jgi:hypothetical protein
MRMTLRTHARVEMAALCPRTAKTCHAREWFRGRRRADCVAEEVSGMVRHDDDFRQKAPFRESGFRNILFLKCCSLFFHSASVSFHPSQHAGYQAKDGITEK